MKKSNLLKISTTAVMIVLTCVLTMSVRIPSPTKGYLNLGDCAVLLSGWLLGPVYGTIAGGVGSALADFLAGYPVYIPGTLIIKALMALLISVVPARLTGNRKVHLRAGMIICSVIAELLMVTGYWIYEALVIGEGFIAAFSGVSGNLVQGIVGAAGTYFIAEALSHTGIPGVYGAGRLAEEHTKN